MPSKPDLFWMAIFTFVGAAASVILGEVWTGIKTLIELPSIPIHWVIFVIAYAVGLILITIDRKQLKSKTVTIHSRDDLPRLDEFFSQAKHEINCIGITLESVTRLNYDSVKNAIQRGIRIRLLMFDPDSPIVDKMEKLVTSANMKNSIQGALGIVCKLKKELGSEEVSRFEVRIYDVLPAFTLIAIDPDTEEGIMHYDPYLMGIAQQNRVIYRFFKSKHKTHSTDYGRHGIIFGMKVKSIIIHNSNCQSFIHPIFLH